MYGRLAVPTIDQIVATIYAVQDIDIKNRNRIGPLQKVKASLNTEISDPVHHHGDCDNTLGSPSHIEEPIHNNEEEPR